MKKSNQCLRLEDLEVQDFDGTVLESLSSLPRMIRRITQLLDGKGEVLLSSRRLAQLLGVSLLSLRQYTASPLLHAYRITQGSRTYYWGNKHVIARLHAKTEKSTRNPSR